MLNALLAVTALSPVQKSVDVPFRLVENAIIADAVVNGRNVSCMFDTGFSGSFVLDTAVNVGAPTGSMMLRDFVGQFEAPTVKIKTLTMGGAKVRPDGMQVVQQPNRGMSQSYNTHTVGIMGLEVMRDYILEINFEKSKFVFHPKSFDFTGWKPDNKKTFMPSLLLKGGSSVELVCKTANGKKLVLALDTGNAFYATTHKDVLERVGIWKPGQPVKFMSSAQVASGPVDSWYMHMEDMSIYGVPVKSSIWSIIDAPSSSADHDGTVGFGFLKNFNILIDMERRRVWLDNFAGKVSDAPKAEVGINAFYDEESKKFLIWRVAPNGPAEAAGVKRGDALLSVNGEELLNVGARKVADMMEGDLDSKVQLVISRNGTIMRMEVKRKYLFNGRIPQPAPAIETAPASGAGLLGL